MTTNTAKIINAIEDIRDSEDRELYHSVSKARGEQIFARANTFNTILGNIDKEIRKAVRNEWDFKARDILNIIEIEFSGARCDEGALNATLGAYYSVLGKF